VEKDPLVTRRDVVRGGGAAFTLATAASSVRPAFALDDGSLVATGVVFEDRSGTGRRQAGDPGIAGVLVSNGREVVKTDTDGRFALPVDDETIIFVIKPTGYAVPIERGTMLPRFYYIHHPKGTPEHLGLRHGGIEPSGPLPSSIDFALQKVDEPSRFDVLMFADPHAGSAAELDFIRDDVVNPLIGTKAAFGLTTGDIMSDDLSLYARYNRIIGQLGVPWHNIVGNHDLNLDAPDGRYSRETFKQTFGPSHYAFEYGGALFLMLDNVDYFGARASAPGNDCRYQGRFGKRQLAFVANVLKETPAERLVVAAMHIPLRTYLDPDDPASNTADGAALIKLLGERPSISFSGHTHTTEHHYLGGEAGRPPHHHHVMTAVSGSWWSGPYDHCGVAVADSHDGTPNGFHVLTIDRNRATTRYQPAKEPNARQVRIVLDSEYHRAQKEIGAQKETGSDLRMSQLVGSPIPQDNAGATDVLVNVFDGGPRTGVEYRIGERAPVRMERERRLDPFVKEVFARNQATKKPWVQAEPCSHLWVARLPADLAAGTHCIKVRVTDEYGREHHDHLVLEVTGIQAASASTPG
jgi:C terminal of Calcineurin-like phosphoesterase/N terminal of Calcineurin-like phosphoesterase/Calcineurin-like phosphoesterase